MPSCIFAINHPRQTESQSIHLSSSKWASQLISQLSTFLSNGIVCGAAKCIAQTLLELFDVLLI
jgi:hypothetical protein